MVYRIEQDRKEVSHLTKNTHQSDSEYLDDVISLTDFWTGLVEKKYIILGCVLLTTVAAVLYAFLAESIYKVEMGFLPPRASDIQALNVHGSQNVTVDYAYDSFKRNLNSNAPRQAVYDKMKLYERLAIINKDKSVNCGFRKFNKNISVSYPKTIGDERNPTASLALKGEDPKFVEEILKQFAIEVFNITVNEIVSNINSEINARKKDLEHEIELLLDKTAAQRMDEIKRLEAKDAIERKIIEDRINALRISAKKNRSDRIIRLEDAAKTARLLGIEYPFRHNSESTNNKSQVMFDLSMENFPLYFLGLKALEAELTSLKGIKNNDAFIPNLRELQAKLIMLKHNRKAELLKIRKNDEPFTDTLRDIQSEYNRLQLSNIKPDEVNAARIDHVISPMEKGDRVWPKPKLIIALGFVFGLMIGVFGVCLSQVVRNKQKYDSDITH